MYIPECVKQFKFPTLIKRDESNYNTAIIKIVADETGNKTEEDPVDLLSRIATHATFLKYYNMEQLQFPANGDLVIGGLAPGMKQNTIRSRKERNNSWVNPKCEEQKTKFQEMETTNKRKLLIFFN